MGDTARLSAETLSGSCSTGRCHRQVGGHGGRRPEGQVQFRLVLDKCVVLNDLQVGDFKYQGLIMMPPGGGDAFDEGADTSGGIGRGVGPRTVTAWSAGSSTRVTTARCARARSSTAKWTPTRSRLPSTLSARMGPQRRALEQDDLQAAAAGQGGPDQCDRRDRQPLHGLPEAR